MQAFKYDALQRLTEARETVNGAQTWKEAFDHDRYGNRTTHQKFAGGPGEIPQTDETRPEIDPDRNRFKTTEGYTFDANGNVTVDHAGRQFTFNGDNKQTQVKDAANKLLGKYFYDGDGKRVKKLTYDQYGAEKDVTLFVYSGGKLIAEYTTEAPPPNPTTRFTVTDHLGSPRVILDSAGDIVSRRDFLPFGEEIATDSTHRTTARKYGQDDKVRQKFTGYQNDEETGLDFAEARMYENRHGRFTAVDPLLASGKSADPQTFNRYVYVMNNPLVLTDPDGLQAGTPKPTQKESLFDYFVRALGLPKPVYVDEPYEKTELGEPSLVDSLAQTATSAIVTFAENNGSELLFGKTEVVHTAGGRLLGNAFSLIQGGAEIVSGVTMTGGGGAATVVTSPACATGVGCVIPAAAGGVTLAGALTAGHGAAVIVNTVNNMVNGDGTKSGGGGNSAKDYNPAGRSKIKTGEDALDQLEGVTKAQENTRKGKGNAIVDSTKKSEQGVDNKNRKFRNLEDAYDDYPDY